MTRHKSFKTRVRTRMDKTGESYTTARRRLVDAAAPETRPTAGDTAPGAVKAQGRSEAVRERTGRDWDEWFALLDTWGAAERTHTEVARWLVQTHEVDGWWAQNVTVAYEQARGLRVPGQRGDGTFSISAGKTVAVPVERLYEAFADAALREKWLPDAGIRVRTATAPKSFRADWAGGPTRIAVGFVAKGEGKAQVGVAHERLADAEAAAEMKTYWRDRLAALKVLLER
ncbi:MAG: hypothetical protein ACRDP6_43920 [Actinoallomurus sp.]